MSESALTNCNTFPDYNDHRCVNFNEDITFIFTCYDYNSTMKEKTALKEYMTLSDHDATFAHGLLGIQSTSIAPWIEHSTSKPLSTKLNCR